MLFENYATPDQAAARAAAIIVARIHAFAPTQQRKFVIVLPVGSTAVPVYRALARCCREGGVSFEHVVAVNHDEYVGLGPEHPQSHANFMDEHFWSKVDLPPSQAHIPYGLADPLDEAARYEALLQHLGGAHLVLAGLGANGHVGFNEPGAGLSGARCVELRAEARAAHAPSFLRANDVPTRAVSLGMRNIVDASEVLILATGPAKAAAVRRTLEGPVSHMCPASMLQLHDNALLITDADAATMLDPHTMRALSGGGRATPADAMQIDAPATPPTPALVGGKLDSVVESVSTALLTPVSPISMGIVSAPTSPTTPPSTATASDVESLARRTRSKTRRPRLRLVVGGR